MSEALNFVEYDPTNPQHVRCADKLGEWSVAEQMLPLSPERLSGHVFGLLAFAPKSNQLVGYRAVTEHYQAEFGDWYELGALVVDPTKRGYGYGKQIADAIFALAKERLPEANLLVFCNQYSLGLSLAHGFQIAGDTSKIPADAFTLCVACPIKQSGQLPKEQVCCDAIVILESKKEN